MESVEDVLNELGITYLTGNHHHTTHGWLQTDCPDCSSEGKYRLGIHAGRGNASCWVCGPKKSYTVIAALAGVGVQRVRDLMKGVRRDDTNDDRVHTGRYHVPFPVGPLKSVHRKYLRSRQFDPDEIAKLWQVQGIAGDGLRWKWRLFVPVTLYGKPVSWTTRSLKDDGPRYRSAKPEWEKVPHKQTVYGLDYVRHSCVVVEGPTGCWRIGPGCVCTFGTRFDPRQVSLLAQVPTRYVLFDPEAEAQLQARRLCDLLTAYPGNTELVQMPGGVDPGSLTPKQVRQVRRLLV